MLSPIYISPSLSFSVSVSSSVLDLSLIIYAYAMGLPCLSLHYLHMHVTFFYLLFMCFSIGLPPPYIYTLVSLHDHVSLCDAIDSIYALSAYMPPQPVSHWLPLILEYNAMTDEIFYTQEAIN